jgi:hypothetical protein
MKLSNKIYSISIILVAIILVSACSKKPDIEYTSTYKMAGEWFTRYYHNNAAVTPFHKIVSYNVSDPAAAQVWVDDLGQWPFVAKFDVDIASLAFKAMSNVSNANTASPAKTLKVLEGKVLPGTGHTKTGVVVDSIYIRMEFSDDPGEIYEIRGHQRTGFFEDEY